ncbi:MAG: hypothetical protein FJ095_15995 [Deltaproteobacteria bacterium]|nr:hypothetical protein [Deltaproteobacteria bacterium]
MLGAALSIVGLAAGTGAGCTQNQTVSRVRALQQAGATTFLCLAPSPSGSETEPKPPADTAASVAAVALPLTECGAGRTDDPTVPHLYALALQPLRGEVAVIDLTAEDAPLVDADPLTPGTNFLPVGAAPTDIVATPGGTAAFVSVGEPGYEGIYALPADRLRGAAPKLSDWPSCSLPERPGSVELLVDAPGANGALRPRCDAAYGADETETSCGTAAASHCHGDLAADAESVGNPGRYKLLVTLPHAGGVAVLDAQSILDGEAGSFAPCPVERFVPLEVKLTTEASPPPSPAEACVPTEVVPPRTTGFTAEPSDIAFAPRGDRGYRLFVSDAAAPVIHRLDLPTACDVTELDPLLATSAEDPGRTVTTSRVAVSPLTFDLKRYLYAVDELDGSLIAYDVSENSTTKTPLHRPHSERNPFQPPDRVRFGSPPREILFAERRGDAVDPSTGTNVALRCDPNAGASAEAAGYRTASDFTSGAGPRKLRGTFGFAVLASGNVVALDVDDLDAACRGPRDHHPLYGCDDASTGIEGASTEYSCQTVAPHQPRSSAYLAYRENVVATQPGLEALPLLFDKDGVVLAATDEGAPRMRATIPVETPPFDLTLPIASGSLAIDPSTGLLASTEADAADAHVLAMNHDDPRAHILAQSWTVTYEGAIPGFTGHFASLVPTANGFEVRDPASGFCGRGVQGASAVADELVALEGVTPEQATLEARALADYVQVTSDTPVLGDKYWTEQAACSFAACQQAYGTSRNPLPTRDLRIMVAKDDILFVEPREGATSPDLKCCFPNVVEFQVRGGSQWIVLGSKVGFLNRGAADGSGVCRSRCDSRLERLEGRVREVTLDEPIRDDSPRAFRNPFFHFAIRSGDKATREMRFEFATQGQFAPLQLALLGSSNSTDIQPAAATFLPTTGELVVSDGSLQGLAFVKLDTFTVSRQYQ